MNFRGQIFDFQVVFDLVPKSSSTLNIARAKHSIVWGSSDSFSNIKNPNDDISSDLRFLETQPQCLLHKLSTVTLKFNQIII